MTRKEFAEQIREVAELQYDLHKKFPNYVHFDVTLSTNDKGKQGIKYNIYTPETSHNSYADFHDFIRFMRLLIKDGLVDVKTKILLAKLESAQKNRIDAIDEIADIKKELEKLKG